MAAAEGMRLWLLEQSWFQSVLMPALPRQLRWLLRKIYLAPIDLADRVLGRRNPALPAKAATFTGAVEDFAASGEVLVEVLGTIAGASPSSHVLDVGCGLGRLARAMSHFLDMNGRYEGLDIVPAGIEWCKQHIIGPYDNLHFTLADVYNKEYNPKGRVQPTSYRFPYPDETFDVAVLVSVFTHMLPVDVDQYVSQIARVLKKNGRLFATYYLITPESRQLMSSRGSTMRFKQGLGPHWIQSESVPELAVAYDEPYIRAVYAKHGLSNPPEIYPGGWCGRPRPWPRGSGLGGQDTVVATKL